MANCLARRRPCSINWPIAFIFLNKLHIFQPNVLWRKTAAGASTGLNEIHENERENDDDDDDGSQDDQDDDFLPNVRSLQPSRKPDSSVISFILNIKDIDILMDNQNVLIPDWSNILADIVWEFGRTPCSWSCERIKIICNEVTVAGRCLNESCEAKLNAYTEKMRSKLNIKITQYKETAVHNKKCSISKKLSS